MHGVLA